MSYDDKAQAARDLIASAYLAACLTLRHTVDTNDIVDSITLASKLMQRVPDLIAIDNRLVRATSPHNTYCPFAFIRRVLADRHDVAETMIDILVREYLNETRIIDDAQEAAELLRCEDPHEFHEFSCVRPLFKRGDAYMITFYTPHIAWGLAVRCADANANRRQVWVIQRIYARHNASPRYDFNTIRANILLRVCSRVLNDMNENEPPRRCDGLRIVEDLDNAQSVPSICV